MLRTQATTSVSLLPKRHSSSGKIPLHCNLCNFSTSMPSFLRLHVEKVHRQGCPPALICPHCGRGAAGYRGLQIHIAHTHKIYRTSGKGKNGQLAPNQKQQVGALVLREQMMKPPQQVGEPENPKIPPSQNKDVKRQHVKRSMSVGASTRRSSKPPTRRSSTTKRTSHRRSSDSCDFISTVQV